MSTEALRKQFEQWYAENAFDVIREPIGSRDCGLQWKAWLAALAAAPAGGAEPVAVPEGWKLVPAEITEEMHQAAVRTVIRCTGNDDMPPRVWRAMLAAAPTAPQPERYVSALDPALQAINAQTEPDDLITVAHVECENGASTLTLSFDQLGDLATLVGEDEETYTVRIAPMTRSDFEALGEFDGF